MNASLKLTCSVTENPVPRNRRYNRLRTGLDDRKGGVADGVKKKGREAPFGRDGTGSLLESFRELQVSKRGELQLKVLSRRS